MYFQTRILVFFFVSAFTQGCIEGGLFKQEHAASTQSVVGVEILSSEDNVVTGAFSAASTSEQQLATSAGTLIIGAGALSGDTKVTIEPGISLSSSELSGLGLGEDAESGSDPVVFASSSEQDPLSPLTIALPVSASLRLALNNDTVTHMVVVYRAWKYATQEVLEGVIPTSSLVVKDGTVQFSTKFFGSFQVIFVSQEVNEPVQRVSESKIESKRDVVAREIEEERKQQAIASAPIRLMHWHVDGVTNNVKRHKGLSLDFNLPVDTNTLNGSHVVIQNERNGMPIHGTWTVDNAEATSMTFSPQDKWPVLSAIRVDIRTDVKGTNGTFLENPQSFVFHTRDGVWSQANSTTSISDSSASVTPISARNARGDVFSLIVGESSGDKIYPVLFQNGTLLVGSVITSTPFNSSVFHKSKVFINQNGTLAVAVIYDTAGPDAFDVRTFSIANGSITFEDSLDGNSVSTAQAPVFLTRQNSLGILWGDGDYLKYLPVETDVNEVSFGDIGSITSQDFNKRYEVPFAWSFLQGNDSIRIGFLELNHRLKFTELNVNTPSFGAATATGHYAKDSDVRIAVTQQGSLFMVGNHCDASMDCSSAGNSTYGVAEYRVMGNSYSESFNALANGGTALGGVSGTPILHAVAATEDNEACVGWMEGSVSTNPSTMLKYRAVKTNNLADVSLQSKGGLGSLGTNSKLVAKGRGIMCAVYSDIAADSNRHYSYSFYNGFMWLGDFSTSTKMTDLEMMIDGSGNFRMARVEHNAGNDNIAMFTLAHNSTGVPSAATVFPVPSSLTFDDNLRALLGLSYAGVSGEASFVYKRSDGTVGLRHFK